MQLEKPPLRITGIVCDRHLADMQFGRLTIGHNYLSSVLDGWKCTSAGCERFFGKQPFGETIGYGDLDSKEDLKNIRQGPACSEDHETQPMYVQRLENRLQWVCPVCAGTNPFQRHSDSVGR
jgi:hypothetical protein